MELQNEDERASGGPVPALFFCVSCLLDNQQHLRTDTHHTAAVEFNRQNQNKGSLDGGGGGWVSAGSCSCARRSGCAGNVGHRRSCGLRHRARGRRCRRQRMQWRPARQRCRGNLLRLLERRAFAVRARACDTSPTNVADTREVARRARDCRATCSMEALAVGAVKSLR